MSSRLIALSSALGLVISAAALAHGVPSSGTEFLAAPALEQGISGTNATPAAQEGEHHKAKHHRKAKVKGQAKGQNKGGAKDNGSQERRDSDKDQ